MIKDQPWAQMDLFFLVRTYLKIRVESIIVFTLKIRIAPKNNVT